MYRKPQADLYTIFLVVALLSLLMGILFLCQDMSTYNFQYKGGPPVGMLRDQGPGGSAQGFEASGHGVDAGDPWSAFGSRSSAVG